MPVAARRVFRLSLTTALALVAGYGLGMNMPFMAPLFGFMLAAAPKPPMPPRSLLALVVLVALTLGVGLLLVPVLTYYPATALLLVAVGLFFSNYLSINLGKGLVATFLTAGITLISAAGLAGFQIAIMVIQDLVIGIVLGVLCLWLVYPWFAEDGAPLPEPPPPEPLASSWLAFRATLVTFPTYLVVLVNPQAYLPIMMKAVSLGQQVSETDARVAGRQLLGSTFLGGLLAILFWAGLGLWPSLWMFFLWMLLFAMYISAKLYGVLASRYPAPFWTNVMVTLLILLGPAVADSANGKDVYKAFAVRIGLFVLVTVYAWLALLLIERWRTRRLHAGGELFQQG